MEQPSVRQVTDSRVLAALAHPLRRRLMDVLKVYGPCTVGMLAEHTGQAPANVSHHLKVLAAADLLVEAPELARDRRERWWKPRNRGVRWSESDFGDDPSTRVVVEAAGSLNLERHTELVRAWHTASDETHAAWNDAPFSTDHWLHLTPDELDALGREVIALLTRWSDRPVPDDGQRREPVFVFAHGVPGRP
ncbi:ArsR/SmtB family transcription factor [Micromonospora tulbaghiae]